jgi:beta-phosphoglucomutase-like phosphatase (HAD superfamily)
MIDGGRKHPPIRIGFDMDGVIADFATAYRAVEVRLFGAGRPGRPDEPEHEEEAEENRDEASAAERVETGETPAESQSPRDLRRRQDAIWREIKATPDFWTTLPALQKDAVPRIHQCMLRHGWEVFFLTQRPATAGATVQRQTQRWLVEHGFDWPSVLVISGSRGAAAAALRLTYHVDDHPQHCIDVRKESTTRPLLIVPDDDPDSAARARKLGIGVAASLSACLEILEEASAGRSQPSVLQRLAALVGWR